MKKFTRAFLLVSVLTGLQIAATAAITVTQTHTDVTCKGLSNGSINITATGGNAPYTYLWNGGATTEDRSGLSSGAYSVTVTDNVGATGTLSISIIEPATISTSKAITNVACGGGNTGAINLTVSGGTPGYTFLWSDFVTTEDRTNLTAAVYYLTITDNNGCIKIDSANVTQPPGVVLSKTTTNVTCGSGANGAINLTAQFGNPGYTYLWNDGVTTEDRTGIAAGTYSVTVTDAIGCSASTTATVSQSGAGMAVNTTNAQPSCNGGSNGTINISSVIGSIGPYSYHWNDGINTQNRTGLISGLYTVTATSSTGCTASASVNLGQPSVLGVTLTPISVTCFGSNNGAINTSPSGGTAPYTYNWGGGVFTQNRTGLSTGTYSVTVTDFKGCTVTASTFVPEPLALVASPVASPLACTGGPTGSVTTSVGGGTAPYSYWWGGGITTPNRTNVNAGTYTVTVTDANGCTATATGTVAAYTPITLTTVATNVACFGATTGSINLTPSNGWSPYTYTWSNGSNIEDISGLAAGSYTVTVMDNHACTASKATSITQPAFGMNINAVVVNPSCNGGTNGTINITASNGNSPYSYNWGGGITTQNRTGLTAGSYTLTVSDNTGCTTSSTSLLTQPSAVSVSPNITDANCYGASTGVVNLLVSGGTSPYSYNWGGGITTQNRTGLAAGTYNVTVTDNHSCSTSASSVVGEATQVIISPSVTNVSCFGLNNGSITLGLSGGTSPYTFNWGGGVTSQNRSSLAAGSYTVTVMDNAGCNYTSSSTITQPAVFTVSSSVTGVSCSGGNNGSITVTTAGGSAPASFNWGSGITTQNRTGLSAGTYTVTATDISGCTATNTATISQPTPLNISAAVASVSCNGGNNGSITETVTGATWPYSFNWGGGVTTQNRTGLTAGTYTVTVTDNAGCTASNVTSVSEPSAISAVPFITAVTCNGGSNGTVSLAVNGGNSPYSYNWGGGITSQNRTSLIAGTYQVTITDNSSCTASASVVVNQANAISITSVATDASCNGGNNGAINLTVNGGTAPYTYNWGGGITTQNRTNLVSGLYTVTVTDNATCTSLNSTTVNQASAIAVSSTTTNVACNGGNNGSINLTISGGISPYTFNWGGGITTQNRTNLTAGSYTVTITDNALCTTTHSANVSQSTTITVNATVTNATCNGGNNGSITTTVSGGTAPYSFNWGSGITTQNRTNLIANNYTVTVTDNSGCSSSSISTVTEPSAITISPIVTNVACAGGNTGAINISVTGGTSPYTFNWGGGITTQNRINVAAGSYTVSVNDNAGCSATNTSIINQNVSLTITATSTNVSCNGLADGAINITSNGGTAPYTYNWGGGITSQNRTGLSAATYIVTVTDNAGCSGANTTTITQPAPLTAIASITNVSCASGNNGAINISVSGGTSPFTFNWVGGITIQNRTGLTQGTYIVSVTDNNSCTTSVSANVSEPSAVSATMAVTSVACFGQSTGAINVTANGGNGSYSYNWGGGIATQNRTNLSAGNYAVTITDANGCSSSVSASITQGTQITTSSTAINATCFGSSNGSIDLSVVGGTGTYTYAWSNGAISQDISSLSANTYNVTVLDVLGCSATSSIIISQAGPIILSSTKTNVTCNGGNTGAIDLTVTGGNSPFNFNWSTGATTEDISNVVAGNYSVVVVDNNSCSASSSISISQPAVFTATTNHTNITCSGSNNGIINVVLTGGTSPFTYSWADGGTVQNRTGLSSGSYSVTVQDVNWCSSSATAIITEPSTLAVTTTKTDIVCNGAASGAIDLTVTGGTPGYLYVWSNGSVNEDLSSVTAGTYSVTVRDANNCSLAASANITQPTALSVAVNLQNVKCFGGNNGSITANANGGNGGYIYNWSNGANTAAITGLSMGNYTLSLQDAMNCATTLTLHVGQPTAITLTETHTHVSCNGGTNGSVNLSVSGGSPGYTYLWNNATTQQDLTNVLANPYTVIVTDANNCTASLMATVNEPAAVTLSATASNISCNGSLNGAVNVTAGGGTTPYNFNWSNGATTQNLTGIAAGNYVVTVSDLNNCTTSASTSVTQPSAITISLTKTDISCFGAANGTITTTVSGGNSGYSFNWSHGPTSQNLNALSAGSYTLTVTDASNCSVSGIETVSQPTQIILSETHTDVSCNNGSNGSISITANGGSSGFSYLWNNTATTSSINNLTANAYSVTVTDVSLCTASSSVIVSQPSALSISETHTPFACSNSAGSINVTVSGGTFPYTYLWTGGTTNEDATNLPSGNYSVTATDANSCSVSTSAIITAVAPLNTSFTKTDVTCNGGNNGQIDLSVSGGSSPYSFTWTNGATTEDLNNTLAGNYIVTVTDNNQCSTTTMVPIAQPSAIQVNHTINHVSCFGGNNGAVNITVTGGNAPYNFNWNTTSSSQNINSLSAGSYALTVTDISSCSMTVPVIAVTEPAALTLSSIVTSVACVGHTDGAVAIQVNGGIPPYSYSWDNSNSHASTINNLTAGNYKVTVTDNNGCQANHSDDVFMTPALAITYNLQNTSCPQIENGMIDLTVTGGTPGISFDWSNGETTEDLSNLAQGAYSVNVLDSRGCATQANFNIGYDYILQVDATPSTSINLGETIQLTATTNVDHANAYSWGPAYNVTCSTCASTEAAPTFNTHYTVSVIDANGCKATDTLTVEVNSVTDIYVPNAFTPNGDGNNDFMQIYGDINTIAFLDFSVFNRWGEKVFETSNHNFTWDGTYKGEVVPQGAYIYTMKVVFINGYSRNDMKGSLTIIR
ncbi:MAG: gliding motility-associated C-terminal domain-containing protein [Chitinophagales bacterium]